MGASTETSPREAAQALGVPEERVDVPYVETGATPPDQGTSSSRSSFFNVLAAHAAAELLHEQLRDRPAVSKAHQFRQPIERLPHQHSDDF